MTKQNFDVCPIGWVESSVTDRADAPKQGDEGAPLARIVIRPEFRDRIAGLQSGDRVLILTWLHLANRDVISVHPRGDQRRPLAGVFATRSPDRPNPIGLHAVIIEAVADDALAVQNLEAIDGTPVLDIKPVLRGVHER